MIMQHEVKEDTTKLHSIVQICISRVRRHSTVLNKKCQIRNKREKRKSNERKVIAKKFGGKEIDKKKRNERMEKKTIDL